MLSIQDKFDKGIDQRNRERCFGPLFDMKRILKRFSERLKPETPNVSVIHIYTTHCMGETFQCLTPFWHGTFWRLKRFTVSLVSTTQKEGHLKIFLSLEPVKYLGLSLLNVFRSWEDCRPSVFEFQGWFWEVAFSAFDNCWRLSCHAHSCSPAFIFVQRLCHKGGLGARKKHHLIPGMRHISTKTICHNKRGGTWMCNYFLQWLFCWEIAMVFNHN